MKKFIAILIILVIAVTFLYNGSSGSWQSGPVTIGFVGPLTGDAASYGEPIRNAVNVAVDEINNGGGINGREVRVIYEDGKCTGRDAVSAAQKLANVDKVSVIIGGVCSGETLAMLPITEERGVVVLSPSASSPDLTGAGSYFFRNSPSDNAGGAFVADVIAEKHDTVAIISEKTDYAQALHNIFSIRYADVGGSIVADEHYAPETGDFRSILAKVKAANPSALFINPQIEVAGATIARQARELGIGSQFYGSNVLSGSKALEVGGEHVEGMYVFDSPGLNPQNEKARRFLDAYTSQYGDLSIEFYLGAAYDLVHIVANAVAETGTADPDKLRDYLAKMTDFQGVIGTYSFDSNGDITNIGPILKKVEGGSVVPAN
ncbi:MAG: ABC transporter substrate-binding protein [Candidatus Kaiserbacteria bacterium]|nr:ABC transporter substrate-binding protein [Candidatus Kaiserbacteria bacterium]